MLGAILVFSAVKIINVIDFTEVNIVSNIENIRKLNMSKQNNLGHMGLGAHHSSRAERGQERGGKDLFIFWKHISANFDKGYGLWVVGQFEINAS